MINTDFCNCFPKPIRPFFAEAVQAAADRLGISDYNATIHLHLKSPSMQHGHQVGGYTVPIGSVVNRNRVKAGLPPKEIEIGLSRIDKIPGTDDIASTRDEVLILVLSLAHEMIHVKQWLTGEMAAKYDANGKLEKKTYYFGVPIEKVGDENSVEEYQNLPWEKEPHERMYKIADYIIERLNKKFG